MIDMESLYLKTPIVLQNVLTCVDGWWIHRTRYGKRFHASLKEYEDRNTWDTERVCEYRDRRLHEFVRHCETTVPYYRRLFKRLGISSEDIRTLEDMRALPILTKQTVQEQPSEFLSESIPARRRLSTHTSGTTGAGLRCATTRDAVSEQWAVWWRYRHWHGIAQDTRCGYFGGRSVVPLSQTRPPFWRFNIPGRQVLFSAYHMSPANMGAYVEVLRRQKLPWLHGYPSLLSLLASYLLERNISLGYSVRWVTIGAESLHPLQTDMIERAFGVRPLQHYGLAEAVANISQHEDGTLRVDEDFSAVEFLPNLDPEVYRIVGTNFSNPAFPLLRYDTGDLAELTLNGAGNGDGGRTVEAIDGRREDYIILKNGSRLGRMDHVFKDMVRIREAQLLQRRAGEILVRVVRASGYTNEDEHRLLKEFRKRVGNETTLGIEYVETIQRSGRGKLRFVISEIQRNDANVVAGV